MSDDYAGPGVPTFGPRIATCPECGSKYIESKTCWRCDEAALTGRNEQVS